MLTGLVIPLSVPEDFICGAPQAK